MNDARSPSEALTHDHEELDRTLEEFRSLPVEESDRRAECLGRFAAGLRHHIRVEEETLFPAFAEGGRVHREIVERMLQEHRRIEAALVEMERRVAEREATADLEVELTNVLWAHNALEEVRVYPWFDQGLSPAARDSLRRALDERRLT